MAKISLIFLVTLFTCLNVALASVKAPSELLKRHHNLAERAHHEFKHVARAPLEYPPNSIPLRPRTAGRIGRRDGAAAEYTLLGCFSEVSTAGINVLNHPVPWNETTIQTCVESCYSASSVPYSFAGVLAGTECRCDNAMSALATEVDQSNCRSQCENGDEQWCGGDSSYQIYYLPSTPSSTVSNNGTTDSTSDAPSPTGINPSIPSNLTVSPDISYGYLGCYEDTTDILTRVLRGPGFNSSSMTPTSCATYCSNLGYPYAGNESGGECFCGATLFANSSLSNQCVQACTGDSTLVCGAPLLISVYLIADPTVLGALDPLPQSSSGEWSSVGCFIDDTNARVMDSLVSTIPDDSLSVDACTDACQASGYTFSGLEYGTQCFCSDTAPTLQADAHDCDMACPVGGGSCGGALRLDVYTSI
jgi:hypothetical protein